MMYAYEFMESEDGLRSQRGPRVLSDDCRSQAAVSALTRFRAVCTMARYACEPMPGAVRVLENGTEIFRWRLRDELNAPP